MNKFNVLEHFQKFEEALRTSEENVLKIQQRAKTITQIINQIYWNSDSEKNHSMFVGSYGRGTAIHVSDVDLLVELPKSEKDRFDQYRNNGQSSLLQSVKVSLQDHYSNSKIRGDGQIVSIKFTDNIGFEILPAFYQNPGYEYLDTNSGGTWKKTDPGRDQKILKEQNKQFHSVVKRFARVIRAWRTQNNVPISGIAIDTLVCNFFNTWDKTKTSYIWFDYLTQDFFEWLNNFSENDSPLFSLDSSFKIDLHREEIASKSETAFKRTEKATQFENLEKSADAENEWKKVFGTEFPTLTSPLNKTGLKYFDYMPSFEMSDKSTRAPIGNAEDTEEFAKDRWQIGSNIQSVKIHSELIMNGFRNGSIDDFKKIPIKPKSRIVFSIKPVSGINWYWKVRNVGPVANSTNRIRGQIRAGKINHEEPITFKGNHYVEVYGISDNTVMYFGRIEVPLDNG